MSTDGSRPAPPGAKTAAGRPPPTPTERMWARRALELEHTSLERVQAVAEKWRTGLTALAGVVTGAAAVAAPFVGKTLPDPARYAVGALTVGAIVGLVWGAWAAMTASFGVPVQIKNSGAALEQWTKAEATRSVKLLTTARRATIVGLVALGLAAMTGFFTSSATSPNSDPPATTALLKLDSGEELCGALGSADDGTSLRITGSDGTSHRVPLDAVTTVEMGAPCDGADTGTGTQ